ncbi:HlyC/CorC family transporter [Acidisoma cellulosilytica]|uniref:HlyC/CorC family transporter n=1 Tax=Acidisoma cellulosilyticum TaxID=2802395 RepID=A0A963Z4F0_9PROT|nr:hemolysin family protein [Acidisoma cellulosilyticum]MCB8882336.1 HlyC/CorC family transporter [Acidisoma cellulosilyticum]
MSIEAIGILVLILINGLFACSELALVSARRARLAVLERKGVAGAAVARKLAENPHIFLPTVQVGITLVSVITGMFSGERITGDVEHALIHVGVPVRFAYGTAFFVTVVLITFLTMVLGELVPKQLALRRPEMVAARAAPMLIVIARVTKPAVWLLSKTSAGILSLFGVTGTRPDHPSEEELKALLAESTQSGVLDSEEKLMIERVLRLADKPVRAIMTPRPEIAWIDRSAPLPEMIARLRGSPHSRFVVGDGSVDNAIGIVLAKNLLDQLLAGGSVSVDDAVLQPMIVPDAISALDAFERLKGDANGMAFVIDEYGSFEGLITAADMLEAIVGDVDENVTDHGPGHVGKAEESSFALDGLMPLDELMEKLSISQVPAQGTYHTAAGLILALLRRVPQVGDRIVFSGWRFEVLAMDGRRVDRLTADRETDGAETTE